MPTVVGNSIKQTVAEVRELQFLISQGLDVNGVKVGNCYAQKIKLYSTMYIDFLTTGVTLVAGSFFDHFSYQPGGNITTVGGATAHQTIVATDADTNWPSSTNALGVNQMFVGFNFGVDLGLADSTAATLAQNFGGLPTAAAADQILKSITYQVREGGNITSNYGLLYDYPAGIGPSGAFSWLSQTTAATTRFDIGVANGGAGSIRKNFVVPQLWKPLVGYQHRFQVQKSAVLKDGDAGTNAGEHTITNTASNLIRIRAAWEGFLVTAEV